MLPTVSQTPRAVLWRIVDEETDKQMEGQDHKGREGFQMDFTTMKPHHTLSSFLSLHFSPWKWEGGAHATSPALPLGVSSYLTGSVILTGTKCPFSWGIEQTVGALIGWAWLDFWVLCPPGSHRTPPQSLCTSVS